MNKVNMGCQADYTQEELELIESVRTEAFKEVERMIDEIEIKCEKEKGWKYIDVLEELKAKLKGVLE